MRLQPQTDISIIIIIIIIIIIKIIKIWACLQVDSLGEINEALRAEYSLRRRMLIERAKVTLQVSPQRVSCLHMKCLPLSDLKGSESRSAARGTLNAPRSASFLFNMKGSAAKSAITLFKRCLLLSGSRT